MPRDDHRHTTTPPDVQPSRDGRDARWVAHRVARREELLEATLHAIRTHGAGVGMDEIAAVAGTSKTVIYRHLGDRLGLYLAVCESVDRRILAEIAQAAAHENTTGPRVLHAVIDAYLRLVERDPQVYRFVVRRPHLPLPDGTDPVTGLSSRIADDLAGILESRAHAVTSGTTRTPGPHAKALAWALVGLVKESADRWLENPGTLTRAQLATYLADFATHGLPGMTPEHCERQERAWTPPARSTR